MQGTGSITDPYQIVTAVDLLSINGSNFDSNGVHYKLMDDIDMSSYSAAAIVINNLHGTIDGNGHAIKNYTFLSGSAAGGFFGYIYGALQNITFDNFNASANGTLGRHGIIAQYDMGCVLDNVTIRNCTIAKGNTVGLIAERPSTAFKQTDISKLNLEGNNITGKVAGGLYGQIAEAGHIINIDGLTVSDNTISATADAGGIAASITGLINLKNYNVYNQTLKNATTHTGLIAGLGTLAKGSTISNVRTDNLTTVTGKDYTGGLFGLLSVTDTVKIERIAMFATINGADYTGGLIGGVSASTPLQITQSYLTGVVNGDNLVGGLIGSANKATIWDIYVTGTVKAESTATASGLIIGQSTDVCTINNSWTAYNSLSANVTGLVIGLIYDYRSISNVYAVKNNYTGATPDIAGVTYISTDAGATADTMIGLDFATIWTMVLTPQLIDIPEIGDFYIAGTVTRNGVGVGGAEVMLFGGNNRVYKRVTTDKDGKYTFNGIMPERNFNIVSTYVRGDEVYVSTSYPNIVPVQY